MARTYDPVICTRCEQPRWPYGGARPVNYTCQRCRDVVAGKPNVVDPRPTDAQRAARTTAGLRLKRTAALGNIAPGLAIVPQTAPPAIPASEGA
jgi:hypothetical protein